MAGIALRKRKCSDLNFRLFVLILCLNIDYGALSCYKRSFSNDLCQIAGADRLFTIDLSVILNNSRFIATINYG